MRRPPSVDLPEPGQEGVYEGPTWYLDLPDSRILVLQEPYEGEFTIEDVSPDSVRKPQSKPMQRGDVLLPTDPLETDLDGFIIISVSPREVECVDLVERSVYRWSMHSDGIHVEVSEIKYDAEGKLVDYAWRPVPITIYEPPPAVAAHLRPTETS